MSEAVDNHQVSARPAAETEVDAAANQAMRGLAKTAGFTTAADPDDTSQVIHRLSLI